MSKHHQDKLKKRSEPDPTAKSVQSDPLRGGQQQDQNSSVNAGATNVQQTQGEQQEKEQPPLSPKAASEVQKIEQAKQRLDNDVEKETPLDPASADALAAAKQVSDEAHGANALQPPVDASENTPPPVVGMPTAGRAMSAVGAAKLPTTDQLTASEKADDYVMANVPKQFRLRINGATRVILAGTRRLPRDIATHEYSADNGVKVL